MTCSRSHGGWWPSHASSHIPGSLPRPPKGATFGDAPKLSCLEAQIILGVVIHVFLIGLWVLWGWRLALTPLLENQLLSGTHFASP